jgi:biotin carboxyl carrier protein
MDYKLIVGSNEFAVDASPPNDEGLTVVNVSGRSSDVAVTAVSANHYHLLVDGRAVNVFVAPGDDGTWVWVEGRARLVQDADKVQRRTSRAPGAAATEVAPPMHAEVVDIMVEVGREVAKGQPVVVVSAMKMKMTLTAPYAGTVTAINARPGDQVERGKILVDIEPVRREEHDG